MKNQIILSFCILALALLPAVHTGLRAQSYYSKDESQTGYWQVFTSPETRNTVVQFFDKNHKLMYEETMPRKYIRLTKSNIRRFDDLLGKLISRNLVAASVKSYDLVADSRTSLHDFSETPSDEGAAVSYLQTTQSNVYVTQSGKLKIILKNPSQQHFDITFLDEGLRRVYHEPVDDLDYGRWFNMSQLAPGNYKLQIHGAAKKLNYRLKVDDQLGFSLIDLK